jgi:hypothetical protein
VVDQQDSGKAYWRQCDAAPDGIQAVEQARKQRYNRDSDQGRLSLHQHVQAGEYGQRKQVPQVETAIAERPDRLARRRRRRRIAFSPFRFSSGSVGAFTGPACGPAGLTGFELV